MKRAAFQILLFSIVTAGPCSNGWCDGYGTVRYFDPNGYYISAYAGGQVVHDNHYDCTLVIYNKPPYIDMVNMNPNAEG